MSAMFSGSGSVGGDSNSDSAPATAYASATQWALNPQAYNGVDNNSVDWAALAQQWIQMKDSATTILPVAPPPPAPKKDDTSNAMDLEEAPPAPSVTANQWAGAGAAPAGWTGWNQWGWGWSGSEMKGGDGAMTMMGYPGAESPAPGYTTGVAGPGYETGYWTAPLADSQRNDAPRRKSYETKANSRNRRSRERGQLRTAPPVVPPSAVEPAPTLDAAKRKQLPAWIREGLEKMEREKARVAEKEAAAVAAAERERILSEEKQMERLADGNAAPIRSKFDSDSDAELPDATEKPEDEGSLSSEEEKETRESDPVPPPPEPVAQRSREEILQETMLAVRRALTEILLEVTDREIHTVCQEELARYTSAQASSQAVGKSKALSAITSGLGLTAYGSSDSESDGEDEADGPADVSDTQLQELIRRRRQEFERTSREIEAELREAEARERAPATELSNGEKNNHSSTPRREADPSRNSATPPPIDARRESTEKAVDKINSYKEQKNKDNRMAEKKRLETIHEERTRKISLGSDKGHTPSKDSASSDSSDSSSSSNSDSEESSSKDEKELNRRKRKRHSSSESDARYKSSKKRKEKKKDSKSSKRDPERHRRLRDDERSHRHEKERSRRKDDDKYEKDRRRDDDKHERDRRRDDDERRHKSGRDYERSRGKYRDEDRRRRKRSHSGSYEEDRQRSRDRHSRDSRDRYSRESRDRHSIRRRERSRSHRR